MLPALPPTCCRQTLRRAAQCDQGRAAGQSLRSSASVSRLVPRGRRMALCQPANLFSSRTAAGRQRNQRCRPWPWPGKLHPVRTIQAATTAGVGPYRGSPAGPCRWAVATGSVHLYVSAKCATNGLQPCRVGSAAAKQDAAVPAAQCRSSLQRFSRVVWESARVGSGVSFDQVLTTFELAPGYKPGGGNSFLRVEQHIAR